jgi:DNA-binding transcriptional LysR family regulator
MHERMNWDAISFDWNQVRAFLATAEEGSLSGAARVLGLAQPTLGRQVGALEARLGVVLFERVGRGIALTPTGQALREHARAMGDAATRVALVAAGHAETVAGRICISASDMVASHVLPDLLVALRARAPEIHVEVLATNALSNLLQREADIALRHTRPSEPDLVARLVYEDQAGLYAAPAFLRRHGMPQSAGDLAGLPLVGLTTPRRMAAELQRMGIPVAVDDVVVFSDNMAVACQMVASGLGLGILSSDVARGLPGLVRVLPDLPPLPVPVWLVTHRDLHTSRRIRVVFDFLAEAMAQRFAQCQAPAG